MTATAIEQRLSRTRVQSRICPLAVAILLLSPEGAHAQTHGSWAGLWSFDGRQPCTVGPGWLLSDDGRYSEVRLPSLRPVAYGRWRSEGDGLFLTKPVADARKSTATALHPVRILERTPQRVVLVTHDRVRRVMHFCRLPSPREANKP